MCTKIHLNRLFALKDLFQVRVQSQKELLFMIIFGFYLTCVLCMRLRCLIAPLWFCTIFQQDSTSTPWGVLLGKLSPVWTILSLNWCSTFSNSLDIVHTGYVWVSFFCWPRYKIDLYLTYLYFSLCPLSQTLWMKCSEIPSSQVLCTAELRLKCDWSRSISDPAAEEKRELQCGGCNLQYILRTFQRKDKILHVFVPSSKKEPFSFTHQMNSCPLRKSSSI